MNEYEIITKLEPRSIVSEQYRKLRTAIDYSTFNKELKVINITSTFPNEGKTVTGINLATVYAQSNLKTLIIDMDLRKPKIFNDFNIKNDSGVVHYLIGQKTLDEIIQKTHIPNLDVLTSGPIPPNPSELILGESMKEMIDELKMLSCSAALLQS